MREVSFGLALVSSGIVPNKIAGIGIVVVTMSTRGDIVFMLYIAFLTELFTSRDKAPIRVIINVNESNFGDIFTR